MEIGTIKPVKIEEEMRSSYLDYAMSVIVSRALPDVRDGLKPVHRRILYAMSELGLRHTSRYKKSARIIGEVLGKYHPHGDTAVYDAMVRMAQDFSMRYVLVDGQGNFGSVDNDPPAAMRYTEARMTEIAEEMLADIDKETVDFIPNFDGTVEEPTVLSAKLPNLLLNGASGIAVGMATNIPPHCLSEICDGISHLIDNPEATIDDLSAFIKGPDFPTGGIILGREGIKNAYATGRGKIIIRARVGIEEKEGRYRIVVTELPYQINKAMLVGKIAELVKNRRIEGIAELRDESDREGMRIVIELKGETQAKQVVNNLYKHTALQSAFFVNMVALVGGQPRVISLKAALQHYIRFRQEVITKRSTFELNKAGDRAHILEGLKTALDHLNEVITTIRRSQSVETARNNLMKGFGLSQLQAQAILEMPLRRLAALERKRITDEYAEVVQKIAYLEDLLANPRKIKFLIKEEVKQLKSKYGDSRHTQISDQETTEFGLEELIPHQEVVVTLSRRGYIKRVPVTRYRLQHRGGRGTTGMVTREADAVRHLVIADTHDSLLFFTNRGRVFHLKCHELPRGTSRSAKGIPLINLISIDQQERVTAVVAVASFTQEDFMVMATRLGEIKKTNIQEFASVRSNGLIAMGLEQDDELISAGLTQAQDEVILVTQGARAIKFAVTNLRSASRTSGGVRGIKTSPGNQVIGMDIVSPDSYLLVVSTNGFGKLTPLREYPIHGRGGLGIKTFKTTAKTGDLVAARVVRLSQELMIISEAGMVIRMPLENLSSKHRITQGASVMGMKKGDSVVAIACLGKPGDRQKPEGKQKKAVT